MSTPFNGNTVVWGQPFWSLTFLVFSWAVGHSLIMQIIKVGSFNAGLQLKLSQINLCIIFSFLTFIRLLPLLICVFCVGDQWWGFKLDKFVRFGSTTVKDFQSPKFFWWLSTVWRWKWGKKGRWETKSWESRWIKGSSIWVCCSGSMSWSCLQLLGKWSIYSYFLLWIFVFPFLSSCCFLFSSSITVFTCFLLLNQAKTLEQEAHPALDKLTSKD